MRLAGHAQLEPAVLRHALFRDVELRHDLHARDDRAVEPLVDRPHRRLEDAVDPVLHVHGIVLRLDVDVARAALNRAVDRRVDQADDGTGVGGQLLDRERLVAPFVFPQDLKLEALGGILQHALRALALLENGLNGRRRADGDLDGGREQHAELVDHRQIGRIRHDDHQRMPLAPIRHEAIAEHQLRGNCAEQLVIDAELRQVHELEAIPLGQPLRVRHLGGMLGSIRFRYGHIELGLGRRRGW